MQYDRRLATFSRLRFTANISRGPITLQILRSLMDIRGWHVILINDCLQSGAGVEQGLSFGTPDAETVALGILEAGAKASFLPVPGTEMIAAGTDGASRDWAKRVIGPACTAEGRARILAFLQLHGWEVTIELFAIRSRHGTPPGQTNQAEKQSMLSHSLPGTSQSASASCCTVKRH
jgi:hypothetical protein